MDLPDMPAKTRQNWFVPAAAALLLVAAGTAARLSEPEGKPDPDPESAAIASRFPTRVRRPPVPEGVATGEVDFHGRAITVACATCHTTREPNRSLRSGTDLATFHRGLHTSHGNLACVACHDAESGYERLKLADGTSMPFADSIKLCGQCHGVQLRDYRKGSHGGMTGFWDTTRGPRERNHCLHCHAAHAPQYPVVMPVAGPRDRFPPVSAQREHE